MTLDTSRADAFGFDGGPGPTPALDRLAESGVRFSQAYATAPMTAPSHVSMFTGLYPQDHGVHENARNLDPEIPLLAELLSGAGYETAAFVSALPLAARFGTARGFDHYDDDFGDAVERSAALTTDAAVSFLQDRTAAATAASKQARPLFLWVHYFDPHAPYAATAIETDGVIGSLGADVSDRYLGEIATVDRAVGRLLSSFEAAGTSSPSSTSVASNLRILVVGDHGESLGDFGERTHGNLLHPTVLRVPLLVKGDPARPAGSVVEDATSVIRTFGTVLGWAGAASSVDARLETLFDPPARVVLAEAMQPFLQYGWQPQVAAITSTATSEAKFTLLEGSADTGAVVKTVELTSREWSTDSDSGVGEGRAEVREALRNYALPSPATAASETLSAETRAQLASLGYIASSTAPARSNAAAAPRASEMTALFDELDAASLAFEAANYQAAIGPLEAVLAGDPGNFAAALRLAVAHSTLDTGNADRYFDRARELSPQSADLQHFEGMHRLRRREFTAAAALFTAALATDTNRTTSLDGLYRAHAATGATEAAADALERLTMIEPMAVRYAELGRLRMQHLDSVGAIDAFEQARSLDTIAFDEAPGLSLDLAVLYMAERRFQEARRALDQAIRNARGGSRAGSGNSTLAMALFKRAQLSVMLNEDDARQRIIDARNEADSTTAQLIRTERLFEGLLQ